MKQDKHRNTTNVSTYRTKHIQSNYTVQQILDDWMLRLTEYTVGDRLTNSSDNEHFREGFLCSDNEHMFG